MKIFRLFLCFCLPVVLSCSTGEVLRDIIGIKAEAPVYLDSKPVSSTEMVFRFSHSVKVLSLFFNPAQQVDSVHEGSEVSVIFSKPLTEGMKLSVDLLVEDSDKNTLNVIIPFRARNDRMPALVFNELRTEYSKPKVEFVEFLALEDGNLGAIKLFIAGHSVSNAAYEFPPAEVKAGDYITLHLRTIEDGCADETGADLALSGGTDAQSSARDFWLPGAVKMLRKTDALWLIDQDDRIIDAVLLSEKPDAAWANEKMAAAAELIGLQKAWLPSAGGDTAGAWVPGPGDAVLTAGTTNTRTICRDESFPGQNRAADWYITATSSASPGKPNSAKRYVPK